MQPALANNGLLDTWADHTVFKEMEKLTGITIEFMEVALSAKAEQFGIVAASGDLPDIFKEAGPLYGSTEAAVEDEILLPLNDYLEENAPNYLRLLNSDETYWPQAVNSNGDVVEFYAFTVEGAGINTSGTMIRQDWLDELSLTVPETYDELHDVLSAFKTAYDIRSPLAINSAAPYAALAEGYGLGYFYWNLDNRTENTSYLRNYNGTVGLTITDAAYKDYVTMLAQWYAEGLLDPDFISIPGGDNSADMLERIYTGQSGVFQLQLSDIDTVLESASDADMALSGMAAPVREHGDEIYTKAISVTSVNTGLSITPACEDVALAVRWLDAWYSDQGFLITNYGEEGVTYTLDENGEPVWTDLILNNPDGLNPALATILYTAMTAIGSEWIGIKRGDIIRMADTYTQEQLDLIDVWHANISQDISYTMPNVYLTAEESAEFSLIWADISTLARENIIKFIVGDRPLEEYDSYLETLMATGGERAIEIYQAALDRYLAS